MSGSDPLLSSFHRHVDRWRLRARIEVARHDGTEDAASRLGDELDALEQSLERSGAPVDRLRQLAGRLGLDAMASDLVGCAVSVAVDREMQADIEALAGAPRGRRGVPVATFLDLIGAPREAGRDVMARLLGGERLLGDGLLRFADERPTVATPLAASPRLIAYLRGVDRPSPPVERIAVAPAERAELIFDAGQAEALVTVAPLLAPASRAVLIVEGPARTGRRTAVAVAAGRAALVLDLERIPGSLATPLAVLRRELALDDALPLLANVHLDRAAPERAAAIRAFVDDYPGPVVVTAADASLDLGVSRPVVRLRWGVPDTRTRRRLWQRAVAGQGDLTDAVYDDLALRYRLGPGGVARAIASARAMSPSAPLTGAALIEGIRHNIAEGMTGLATRVEVTQSWDDLVLSGDAHDQVDALVARVRHAHRVLEQWGYRAKLARGTGVAALFSGPPGTGKTMVAGLIARELGLELYQVDLSQVVSKWIGETEKQLARLFDAAEAGHALLLFDEADALFGQRTADAKQAVDRYANLEVNFLLQRIEGFGGITILTTNLDTAIDRALKRRLAAHIVFPAPDEDERAALWRRLAETGSAPLAADLDADELAARYPAMTGANIRNAALAAAFHAAADGSDQITQQHLHRAARGEYRSMGYVLAEQSSVQGRLRSRPP